MLNELVKTGYKKKTRVARGPGSKGKTAGRGHKGQNSRSGGGVPILFEGGQSNFVLRTPKRGFKNPFRKEYNPINLDTLNRFDEGTKVTPEVLAKAGLLKKPKNPVKLLGRGTLEKAMNVALHKFSESAKEAVVKAGGTVEEI